MCSRCARPTPHTTGLTVQLTPDSDWQNRNFTLNNTAFPEAGDLLGQIKESYQQKQKWSQQTRYTKEQGLKGKKQHGCGRQSISIHKCPGTSASIKKESLKMKTLINIDRDFNSPSSWCLQQPSVETESAIASLGPVVVEPALQSLTAGTYSSVILWVIVRYVSCYLFRFQGE